VRNEFPFSIRSGPDDMLTGVIDRVVVGERDGEPMAVDVLDFKTDTISNGTEQLNRCVQLYRNQMQAYRSAICRLWRLPEDRVQTRLIFLETGISVPIEPD
jgi:ATP-dependent exoDNAse (exonuclease V) beta subunit